ncbi:MAG: GNAT family N-acetyltransferase [Proteobacteria bacterium]|nr:GNAT family N-acetyltransferase [Pseudomonadota bacterium]
MSKEEQKKEKEIIEKQRVYHIGRVVVNEKNRKQGLATVIMQACIDELKNKADTIEISAQSYLTGFYHGFEFQSKGEYYLEDSIPHEKMVLSLKDCS